MLHSRRLAAALLLGGFACGPETGAPVEGAISPPSIQTGSATDQLRLERMARRMAIALRNPQFRQDLMSSLSGSPYRENKLELQQVLRAHSSQVLKKMALENGESEALIEEELAATGSLEIYLPFPAHRMGWHGTDDLLVATSARDGDEPVAFDLDGLRYQLDPKVPPGRPVMALVPAELDFTRPAVPRATCTPETCPTGGGGGGSGGSVPPAPRGIYLTQANIIDLHEDWLRGSPEIEAMFMGPLTDTSKMNLVACANESASPPRFYDQNNNNWSGNVLIADSMQLERVRAAYPAGTPWNLVRFTVAFWEDDTGRCQIATSVDSWKNKLLAAGLAVLGGMVVLSTDWTQPIDKEAWPFIVQLPLGLLGLIGTIGGSDDFIGNLVNRTVWNPLHPDDAVFTTQVILDGKLRNGTATIVWR